MLSILNYNPTRTEALEHERAQGDADGQPAVGQEGIAVLCQEAGDLRDVDAERLRADVVVEDLQHPEQVLAMVPRQQRRQVQLDGVPRHRVVQRRRLLQERHHLAVHALVQRPQRPDRARGQLPQRGVLRQHAAHRLPRVERGVEVLQRGQERQAAVLAVRPQRRLGHLQQRPQQPHGVVQRGVRRGRRGGRGGHWVALILISMRSVLQLVVLVLRLMFFLLMLLIFLLIFLLILLLFLELFLLLPCILVI